MSVVALLGWIVVVAGLAVAPARLAAQRGGGSMGWHLGLAICAAPFLLGYIAFRVTDATSIDSIGAAIVVTLASGLVLPALAYILLRTEFK